MDLHHFVLFLHVLGAGALLGVVLFSLVLNINKPTSPEKIRWIQVIRPWGMYAAFWLLLTGLHLVNHDWDDFRDNPYFWTKMAVFVIEGFISERIINRKLTIIQAKQSGETVEGGLTTWMWLSVGLVVVLIFLGMFMDAFHRH